MERKKALAMENIEVPILLVTVQHTASRFMVKLLQEHYGSPWPIYVSGCPFYFDHCRDANMDSIRARHNEGALLITTERNWDECLDSWRRRNVQGDSEYYEQRYNWEAFVEPNAAVILDPNRGSRDHDLETLSLLIGKPLTTDWSPVG